MALQNSPRTVSRCAAVFLSIALSASVPADNPEDSPALASIRSMRSAAGGSLEVQRSKLTGLASFVSVGSGHGVVLNVATTAPAAERAQAFLKGYGAAFGIADPSRARVVRTSGLDETGMEHVRLQQLHGGVPVTAGELTVHLRANTVVAVLAKTLPDLDALDTSPRIDAAQALEVAKQVLSKHSQVTDAELSTPRLEVLNKGLLEGGQQPSRLAWFIEARKIDLREYLWVDAQRGGVALQFSQLTDAKSRRIHNAGGTNTLPGTLVRTEGGPATGNPDEDAAYDFSGDAYDYFRNEHGRDSFDGKGAIIRSTVNFCDPTCPFQNAFWNGIQLVYGPGFSLADDVDAHELAHAVTERSANLFYYTQSGALNESFSDIFGETVDLMNGDAGTRWLLGEDLPGIGAIRDMMNPPAFGDPGKVSDTEYKCTPDFSDRGGVHSNSGVPNHAYALMVDGGTYNGQSVTGIGLTKAGKVQYRALTSYLTSGSNFLDNFNALNQSCTDLIGVAGITAADCTEVGKALTAVEMSSPAICTVPVEPALCPVGQTPRHLVFESLEAGGGNLLVQTGAGSNVWFVGDFFAKSKFLHVLADPGFNTANNSDSRLILNRTILVPAAGTTRMQFSHAYEFETNGAGTVFFDGGVIEYSTDGGVTWNDAGGLRIAGDSYGGTLVAGNVLGARPAFVGSTYGYTGIQLDLGSTLAGQTIRFRWRFGSDSSIPYLLWAIDDVQVYQCVAAETVTCKGQAASVVGTDGSDLLVRTNNRDVAAGRSGNDIIRTAGGNDLVCAGSGNDNLGGGTGNDKLYGESGNDKLSGDSGKDTLDGASGKDNLSGGTGNDKLYGESGNDKLSGASGNDTLDGASGKDKLNGGGGRDNCKGGSGKDTATQCERTSGVP